MRPRKPLAHRKDHQGQQILRQWHMLQHIHQSRNTSLAALAAYFRVSPKTARRDIAILQHVGFPVHVEKEGRLRLERQWCFCGGEKEAQS